MLGITGVMHIFTSTLWSRVALFAVAYFVAAKLGVLATFPDQGIAILWPPNAILLAALLLSPRRDWPKYLAAVIPAEVAADMPHFSFLQGLLFASVNIAECWLAAYFLQRTTKNQFDFYKLEHIALFALVAMIIASGLAGLMGAGVYALTTHQEIAYATFWRIWWFGDGLALLILFPVLFTWLKDSNNFINSTKDDVIPWLLLVFVTFAGAIWIFSQPNYLDNEFPFSPIALVPLALWSAIRFGVHGVTVSNTIIAGCGIYFTVHGLGPFAHNNSEQATLVLQEYLAAITFSSLALSAVLHEIQQKNKQLQLYRHAFEALDEGVMITDTQSKPKIVYANTGLQNISGYTLPEILGNTPKFLQGPETDIKTLETINMALAKQEHIRLLIKNHHKQGRTFWNDLTISPVKNEQQQVTHFVGVIHDVTPHIEQQQHLQATKDALDLLNRELEHKIEARTQELSEANAQLMRLASTDTLTGIANRRFFLEQAQQWFNEKERYPLFWFAFDLDFFKQINDSYGHAIGDLVLVTLCQRIQAVLPEEALFARFGGEEFVVLIAQHTKDQAIALAEQMRTDIGNTHITTGEKTTPIHITVSIGVTQVTPVDTFDHAMIRGDRALYAAKDNGRNCWVLQ